MKLTKQTLKRIIREELEDGALTADTRAVDHNQLTKQLDAALNDAIKQMEETMVKPLVGNLISGHEDKGPVVDANLYEADYAPGFEVWVRFENGSRKDIAYVTYG